VGPGRHHFISVEIFIMAKKPSKFADEVNAVPEIDPLDVMLRRIDAFVADTRALLADLECHLKSDNRERQLLQMTHTLLHDAAVGIEQAHLRNKMLI
jgi:hypothetical protein